MILLNELSPEPHNTPLKVFASRRGERERSPAPLERLVFGLWRLLTKNALDIDELTAEYVMRAGHEGIQEHGGRLSSVQAGPCRGPWCPANSPPNDPPSPCFPRERCR